MIGCTEVGIGFADFDHVFIGVPLMRVVKLPVVQIVDVVAVDDGRMATARAVNVRMIFDWLTGVHRWVFLRLLLMIVRGVRKQVADQNAYMIVGQAVVHVFAFPTSVKQLSVCQHLQPL